MIYTVTLVACLVVAPAPAAAEPVRCVSHEMLIEAGASPVAAFLEAQTKAAEWLAQHPDLAQRSITIVAGRGV